jgi:uncharacterized membrane protein
MQNRLNFHINTPDFNLNTGVRDSIQVCRSFSSLLSGRAFPPAISDESTSAGRPGLVWATDARSDMKILRLVARLLLGGALIFAGIGHLTVSRVEFQAQVPVWLPFDPDFVVVASGVVEIALGIGLVSAGALVPWSGLAAALFFIAIFPGNINQYVEGISAFGLDTDEARFTRLFFQPVLVVWALWSTGAISYFRERIAAKKS